MTVEHLLIWAINILISQIYPNKLQVSLVDYCVCFGLLIVLYHCHALLVVFHCACHLGDQLLLWPTIIVIQVSSTGGLLCSVGSALSSSCPIVLYNCHALSFTIVLSAQLFSKMLHCCCAHLSSSSTFFSSTDELLCLLCSVIVMFHNCSPLLYLIVMPHHCAPCCSIIVLCLSQHYWVVLSIWLWEKQWNNVKQLFIPLDCNLIQSNFRNLTATKISLRVLFWWWLLSLSTFYFYDHILISIFVV